MDVQSPPRLLKPVASSIRPDGAPYVRLSPHKGMRNASIIYEAIRNQPDSTAIRGDFDKNAYPLAYFPAHVRKVIGASPGARAIRARNIQADRKEFASFLLSIAEAGYRSGHSKREIVSACAHLRQTVFDKDDSGREFRVGEIRESLRVLAHAYERKNIPVQKSPSQLATRRTSKRQLQQFDGFTHMSVDTFRRLYAALPRGRDEKYDIRSDVAIVEMQRVLKAYQQSQATCNQSFTDFLRKHGASPYLHTFAIRWLRMSLPQPSAARAQLDDLPWAARLDEICKQIVREFRRNSRVRFSDGEEAEGFLLAYQRGTKQTTFQQQKLTSVAESFPELPPLPLPANPTPFTPKSVASPGLSPLDISTPEDERQLRRVISQVEALPRFDIDQDIDSDLSVDLPRPLPIDDSTFTIPDFGSSDHESGEVNEDEANERALAAILAKSLVASGVTIDTMALSAHDGGLPDLPDSESLISESLITESSATEFDNSVADISEKRTSSS